MAIHSALADSELHENKGVAGATDGAVATATSGATVWQKIGPTNVDTSVIFTVNKCYLTTKFKDIASADSMYVLVPFAGTLDAVYTVLENAITTANNTVTVRNNAGTSMGTITVTQSGSAAGDVDSLLPVSNNIFTAGQTVHLDTDGASDTAAELYVTLVFTITG